MPEVEHNDEARLNAVLAGLEEVRFPCLDRPAVPYGAPPTQELIEWAMRFYASVLLSHVRQLLRTFLLAVREGQKPSAFVLGRAIFELGAHATLVYMTFEKRRGAQDFEGMWKLFDRATMGNLEMRQRGELTPVGEEWLAPFHVNDAIRALDAFFAKTGRDDKAAQVMYDALSEHSHPNQGAFSQYYCFEESPKGTCVVFLTLREDYSPPPFPEVCIGVAVSIHNGALLLEQAGDRQIANLVHRLMDKLDGAHP